MDKELQRITIAEMDGFKDLRRDLKNPKIMYGIKNFDPIGWEEIEVPDYLNNIEKAREIISDRYKTKDEKQYFMGVLEKVIPSWQHPAFATSEQFCKALLKDNGLYKNENEI